MLNAFSPFSIKHSFFVKLLLVVALTVALGRGMFTPGNLLAQPTHELSVSQLPHLPTTIKVKPATFLMLVFNSPYCSACHAMAPTVQALQSSLKPSLSVLRIDRTQTKNEALSNQYTVTSTPTFILFSPCGKPLYQMRDKLYPKTLTQQITQHVQSPASKKAGC